MTGLVIYAVLALAAMVLFAAAAVQRRDGKTADTLTKIGLGLCVAAGVIFGVWFNGLGHSGSGGPWAILGIPLFAGIIPGTIGSMIGSLIVFCSEKIKKGGLSLPGKIGCVVLLTLGTLYLMMIPMGIIRKEAVASAVGALLALIFLTPGLVLLLKWIKK